MHIKPFRTWLLWFSRALFACVLCSTAKASYIYQYTLIVMLVFSLCELLLLWLLIKQLTCCWLCVRQCVWARVCGMWSGVHFASPKLQNTKAKRINCSFRSVCFICINKWVICIYEILGNCQNWEIKEKKSITLLFIFHTFTIQYSAPPHHSHCISPLSVYLENINIQYSCDWILGE